MEENKRVAQYINRPLSDYSREKVIALANSIGITRDIVKDLHVTLVYTKTPMEMPKLDTTKLFLPSEHHFEKWNTQDGKEIVVLVLEDIFPLQERVDYFNSLGATSDFPEYKAHISITYFPPIGLRVGDVRGVDTFVFEGEVYEDVYTEWTPSTDD